MAASAVDGSVRVPAQRAEDTEQHGMNNYSALEKTDVSSFLKRQAFDAPDSKFFALFEDKNNKIRHQELLHNTIVACGQTIPNKKDEDRFTLCSSTDEILQRMYGFGVYDGHGGTYGSELCSDKFFEDVINDLRRKLALVSDVTNLEYNSLSDDVFDTLLGGSIRKITKALNAAIKADSRTGTTAVNLIIRQRTDGSHFVYCANTGDSRCVGHYMKKLVPMSEDHKLGNAEEVERINAGKTVALRCLPIHFTSELSSKLKKEYQKVTLSEERESSAKLLHSIMSLVFDNEHSVLTTDLRNQLSNAVDNINLICIPSGAGQDSRGVDDDDSSVGDSRHDDSIVHYSQPDSLIDDQSQSQLTETAADVQSSRNNSASVDSIDSLALSPRPRQMYDTQLDDDNHHLVMEIKHRKSFISSRTDADGDSIGPKALFSRHGVSMTMTRSIGDRHGARSAVCTPDITKLVVKPGQFARFIMGSDGIWDVISSKKAISLTKYILDPIRAALALVKRARKIREENQMYMDDITCLVIDINPECNPATEASCLGQFSMLFE